MASASEITVKVKVELDMPDLTKPAEAGPDFPKSPYELDLHNLASIISRSPTYFALGARQRLQGTEHPIAFDNAYKDGWEWADRIVAGLEIVHHVESGRP